MQLYYLPGSCALAPHIALEQAGLDYETVKVERGQQTSPAYLAINPLARVPALMVDGRTVTEVPAVLSVIADRAGKLIAPVGDPNRYETLRWLAYFSSTVHPAFARLWRSERFSGGDACGPSVVRAALDQLIADFAYIDGMLEEQCWLVGDDLTVADLYLFVFGRWGQRLSTPTGRFPNLLRHTIAIAELPATQAALLAQGVTLRGPMSGPG
jgi:glutathione S-transferase